MTSMKTWIIILAFLLCMILNAALKEFNNVNFVLTKLREIFCLIFIDVIKSNSWIVIIRFIYKLTNLCNEKIWTEIVPKSADKFTSPILISIRNFWKKLSWICANDDDALTNSKFYFSTTFINLTQQVANHE